MAHTLARGELVDYVPAITQGLVRVRVLGRLLKERPEQGTTLVLRVTSPSRPGFAYRHGEIITTLVSNVWPRGRKYRPDMDTSELGVVTREGEPLWTRTVDGADVVLSELNRRTLLSGANKNASQRTTAEMAVVEYYRAYAATMTDPDRFVIQHRDATTTAYTR